MSTRDLPGVSRETRERVEVAIARGWTTSRILTEYGIDYADIQTIRDAMADPS